MPLRDKDKKVLANLGWIELDKEEKIVRFKNYPCLACSFFGTSGLKSLVKISLLKKDRKVFEKEIGKECTEVRDFLFAHQFDDPRNKRRKMFLEVIKKEVNEDKCGIMINISIRKPLTEKLYVKGKFNVFEVGVSLIWLSLLLINGGLLRFGRFTSRGLGHIKIVPMQDSFGKIVKKLNTSGRYSSITKRSMEIIVEELRSRLAD